MELVMFGLGLLVFMGKMVLAGFALVIGGSAAMKLVQKVK
jgi:hypothetical protein